MEIGDIKIRDAAIFSPIASFFTLPKTNIAPEKGWFGKYFHFGKADFQVLC